MTMSIVSASIQMCKAIRDLVYDLSNCRHRERVRLCVDSVDKTSSKLRDLLLSCDFQPRAAAASAHPHPLSTDHASAGADASVPDAKTGSAKVKPGAAAGAKGGGLPEADNSAPSSAGGEGGVVGLSRLTASSPTLNLSTSSVGSISDIERDIGVSD